MFNENILTVCFSGYLSPRQHSVELIIITGFSTTVRIVTSMQWTIFTEVKSSDLPSTRQEYLTRSISLTKKLFTLLFIIAVTKGRFEKTSLKNLKQDIQQEYF